MSKIVALNPRTSRSTREFVYNNVKNQIINLELEPGTKISEKEIAEKLEVSRTPVREAFLMLAEEELLGIFPQIGTIVTKIDLDHLEEARFVRERMETAIVRMACELFKEDELFHLNTNIAMQQLCIEKGTYKRLFELDEEFHRILFEGCHKLRTWEMVRRMNSHFDRFRILRLASKHDWELVVSQHQIIFDAITDKDANRSEEIMSKHLQQVLHEKDEMKARFPEYFKS